MIGQVGNSSQSIVSSHSREIQAVSISSSVRPVNLVADGSSRNPNSCLSNPSSPLTADAGISMLIPCISICGDWVDWVDWVDRVDRVDRVGWVGCGRPRGFLRGLDICDGISRIIIISIKRRASSTVCSESLNNRICSDLISFSCSTIDTYLSINSLVLIPCLLGEKLCGF